MKRIFELNREQLVALTEEQIAHFIAIETAHAGHIPVLCPDAPEYVPVDIEKTAKGYKVHGIILKTIEDANTIARMAVLKESYDYGSGGAGYDYRYFAPETDVTVGEVFAYEQADVVRLKDALNKNKVTKKQYDNEAEAYKAFSRETESIYNEVWDPIREARDFFASVDTARKLWASHLSLAENDTGIAANFFCKAYDGKEMDEVRDIILAENDVRPPEDNGDDTEAEKLSDAP